MNYNITQTKQHKQTSSPVRSKKSGPNLDIVILLVFGVFILIFGLLLFKIQTGELTYNSNGTYGLLLVIFSLQIITLGRTHFGDFRRSWMLVIIGVFIAILGTVTCLIPWFMEGFIRELVGFIILAGGISLSLSLSLFLQLVIAKNQARMWIRTSNMLRHLTIALGLVYFIEAIIGLVTLLPSIKTNLKTAVLCIIFGISLFYLIWCLQKVTKLYPPEETIKSPSEQSDNKTDKKDGFFFQGGAHLH